MAVGSTLAQPTDKQLANLPNIYGKTPRRNALSLDKLPYYPMLRSFPLLTSQADVFRHDSLFLAEVWIFAASRTSRIELYESRDVPRL